MKIEVYAVLKEYFEKQFCIEQSFNSINDLKNFLIDRNPASADVLNISRFAVDNEFVDNDYTLKENDKISIMPPSSGG